MGVLEMAIASWSDRKKWLMGIVSALIVAAIIAIGGGAVRKALKEQLQGKVPIEAVGTYQVRDPSLPNATAKITYIGGAQFQFERSDNWKQTFVWDKGQQVFMGPNAQDRAYYFSSKGVLAFETMSFWYR